MWSRPLNACLAAVAVRGAASLVPGHRVDGTPAECCSSRPRPCSAGAGRRGRPPLRPTSDPYPVIYLVVPSIWSYCKSVVDIAEEGAPTLHRLRRELARGTAELAVLSILSSGRRYGYELLKLLQTAGAGVLEIKEGTLYPLLHRLEDAGLIASSWEVEGGRGRPRKYYSITDHGRGHLALLRAEWSELVEAMRALLDTLDGVHR
nr:MAG: hypothetical protein DIU60_13665 [Actinomycetota bacterium]